ncbi:HAD family hydrolase [Ferdinandcohnia quinoae]|uniref:HAD family hydrolase n=1 Tax=Fredinandcohnia quinoae TaxID=2918902 RepID=A0AAW5DX88_9BACI|nr:HAD family hydrolase [Fredinandcohnia sp. SECRCQ15]MCH1625261.1 HAD family hydrolase [Fredinandcohnia sp. SECRCQ15]
MIKAIIFDLDGTLLNRDASVVKFIEEQYERLNDVLGYIPKEEYIKRFIELDYRGYIWKDKVYQKLTQEYNIRKISWETLLEDYLATFKNHCVPFPNLIHMLEELKKRSIRLGMITNGFGQFQMDNIKALGITDYFDSIIISETEGLRKPNPAIFHRALNRLGIDASESIFVGDHPDNDVAASMNVGMKGVWKKDPQWNDVEADFIIDDLLELMPIVERF